ncbi:hypothetical protein [Nostoc linckia]|nr:hypothetical protein [Nostoc linckia]
MRRMGEMEEMGSLNSKLLPQNSKLQTPTSKLLPQNSKLQTPNF